MSTALGRFVANDWAAGGTVLAVSVLLTTLTTDFYEPPRGDGAGYSVLGASVAEGRGYREINKPREPAHAHYPPGYPLVLAAVWTIAGRSEPAAHSVSIGATAASVVLAWLWFRSWYRAGLAFGLALALALNWTWARLGGHIVSEPIYQFWQMLALVLAGRVGRKGGTGMAVALGLALGAATLTRYVGAPLAAAVAIDLALRNRALEMWISSALAALVVLPWAFWMVLAENSTHLGLLPGGGGLHFTVAQQALFYLQRIPDQIVGPFVEVGTIYRRSATVLLAVHVWAVLAAGLVLTGWIGTLKTRKRIVGLWGFGTLALLLVWPFTEAGRFLVPLVPALLVGAVEGLSRVLGLVNVFRRRARRAAVALMVAVSVPYSVHAVQSHRVWTSGPLDEACRWLADEHLQDGAVLTMHPAEVYWQSGRKTWKPETVDLDDPESLRRLGIAFVLVEPGPPDDPLEQFVETHPARLRLRMTVGARPGVRVYERRW